MTGREKLAAGRLMAREKCPYFASALLSLVVVEAPGLGTLAVTKRSIMMVDYEAIGRWTVPQICAVLLHEIGHLLRDHFTRCEKMGADPGLWNIAGDAEINDDLIAGGFDLPDGPVLPKSLGCKDGLTAEEYYRAAQKQNEEKKNQQQKPDKGGRPSQPGQSPAPPSQGSPGQQPGQGQGQPQTPEEKPAAAKGWCGSGAGRPVPGEPEATDKRGRSEAEQARARRAVADAITNAASKGRGDVPAGWVRWAEQQLKPPKIPWQQKLARHTRAAVAYRAGCQDYRYDRPSRRQYGIGIGPGKPILPSLRAPVPRVALVLDTSGSMGNDDVTIAVQEARGILVAAGMQMDFVACDAEVHALQQVRNVKELAKLIKGGGGTDFVPAFDALSKRAKRPDVVVFVTDGQGPAPAQQPRGMKVIWLLVGPYKQMPTSAADGQPITWGEVIEVEAAA